ncbi:unnamed protein product [marine sediment metagenome]|uniref:CR-type domain-containing protein n=1 Tax=marine sediment metagenome TaxID=412755 RepID=X1LW64_9ZZZZ
MKCPECQGKGFIDLGPVYPDTTEPRYNKSCPNCNGIGKIREDKRRII